VIDMAVDPATAKIIAKAVLDVLTDEKKRRRLLIIILIPVITVVLLITMLLFLISTPMSLLLGFLLPDEIKGITDLQMEYGYNQFIGENEKDYKDGSGQSYGEVTLSGGSVELVYYNQLDSEWIDGLYGTDKFGSYGCGPTAMAMVVSSLTETVINPLEMAAWAAANGHWLAENGSFHSIVPGTAMAYGLPCAALSADDQQGIKNALSSGKLVVIVVGKGNFTKSQNFIILRGITANGKILVADPISKSRSEKEWDLKTILKEVAQNAASGDPIWVIG